MFLGHFPISTDQIKNLWRDRSNMKSKRWKWVFWCPHTKRQLVLSRRVVKKYFAFLVTPYCQPLYHLALRCDIFVCLALFIGPRCPWSDLCV